VVDLAGVNAGLAICYDVRFPDFVRAYAARGIDACLWRHNGEPTHRHWRTLLKAGLENQIFVAARMGLVLS